MSESGTVSASGETGASFLLLLPLLTSPAVIAPNGAPHKRQKRASLEEKAPQLEQCFVIAIFTRHSSCTSLTNDAAALFHIAHDQRASQTIMQRAPPCIEGREEKTDSEYDQR